MGLLTRAMTALATTPVTKAVITRLKSASGGHMHSQQATTKYDEFFGNLKLADTDAALAKIGIARHQLEILLDDDEIDEKIERRLENLVQAEYTLSPSEGDVAKMVYMQLDLCLESILIASMDAKLFGYSVCEYEWTSDGMAEVDVISLPSDIHGRARVQYVLNGQVITTTAYEALFMVGRRYIKTVTAKPMEWFEPRNDGRLFWYPDNNNQPVEVCTRYKYLLQRYRATYKNPRGRAILSRIYWLWFFKKNGWTFWSKFLERFGSPLLLGTTEGDPDEMANALATAHTQSIFTMPDGDTVNTIGAVGNGETFKAYDDAINRRLSRYLLGATLTSGTDTGGTYGQGKVHQTQQEIVFNGDKKFATKYVQQFINTVCEMNGVEAPQFTFRINRGAQTELAQRDMMLVNQGLVLNIDYYCDSYDIDRRYIDAIGSPRMMPTRKVNTDANAAAAAINYLAKSATDRFTPEQRALEDLAQGMVDSKEQPISTQILLDIILEAEGVDEMQENLYAAVGNNLDATAFTELMTSAVMVADMRGMVDETIGK